MTLTEPDPDIDSDIYKFNTENRDIFEYLTYHSGQVCE